MIQTVALTVGFVVGLFVGVLAGMRRQFKLDNEIHQMGKKSDGNTIKMLQSRMAEQAKLYKSIKNDAKQNASAAIERLEHVVQNLKNLKGFLK